MEKPNRAGASTMGSVGIRVLPCLGFGPEPFGNRHHARDDPRPLRNHLASEQQKQHLWHKSSQHLQAAPCTRLADQESNNSRL